MLRTIVAGMLIVTVTSCTSWKPVLIRPETYLGTHNPESIWVQLQDSSTFILERPRVVLDTLRGINAGAVRLIPLSDVARLRALEPAGGKTALLVAVSVVATVAAIYLAAHTDRIQP
jgi:hypothetical protein